MLYSDMKEGVISKSDYIELHAAYENKRKDAQIAIHKIELEMESILEKIMIALNGWSILRKTEISRN